MSAVEASGAVANVLARKFVSAVLEQTRGNSSVVEGFREVLLGTTLKYAWEHSPYYRERLPERVRSGKFPLNDLCTLPILTKAEFREHHLALRTSEEPGIVQNTTGTTGDAVRVYRTDAEIGFLKAFTEGVFTLLAQAGPCEKPLALEVSSAYHGNIIPLPRQQHILTTGLFDSVLLDQAARWLLSTHSIPHVQSRVSTITGVYHLIEWFTLLLSQRSFPFQECEVARIITGGGYITDRWKRVLANTWNADVTNVYSITEIYTRATSCGCCNGYHFLPDVIPELVDLFENGRLASGIGHLVLTSLFPFAQGQPAIRYQTGDIFRRQTGRCQFGDSYFFLGRTQHSVCASDVRGKPLILGSAELITILDESPEIARSAFLGSLLGCDAGRDIGRPIFRATIETAPENNRKYVKVLVQPTFDPFLFQDAWVALRTWCEAQIRARFPDTFDNGPDAQAGLEVCYAETCCDSPLIALDERKTERTVTSVWGHDARRYS